MTRPCLHVCITCRAGEAFVEGVPVMGRRLHEAIRDAHDPEAMELRSVSCMANCERGCSAAITQAGKWSYLLADLSPALAGDLIDYAARYAASPNGTVLPSKRAASLRNVILGRLPPPDFDMNDIAA